MGAFVRTRGVVASIQGGTPADEYGSFVLTDSESDTILCFVGGNTNIDLTEMQVGDSYSVSGAVRHAVFSTLDPRMQADLVELPGDPWPSRTSCYVSPGGSDSDYGGPETPFATIQHAIGSSASGDTIRLYDGTYSGAGNRDLQLGLKGLRIESVSGVPASCVLDCGGENGITAGSVTDTPDPVWIEGLRLTKADTAIVMRDSRTHSATQCVLRSLVIDQSQCGVECTNREVQFEQIRIDAETDGVRLTGEIYGLIDGLRVTGATNGVFFGGTWPGAYIYLDNADIIGNGYGIAGTLNLDFHLQHCHIDSNSLAGIHIDAVEQCYMYLNESTVNYNGGDGIWISSQVFLRTGNSEVSSNNGTGVFCPYTNGIIALGNTLVNDNGEWGIDVGWAMGTSISECTVLRNGAGGFRTSVSLGFGVTESIIAQNGGTGLVVTEPFYSDDPTSTIANSTVAMNSGNGIVLGVSELSITNVLVANNDSLGISINDTIGFEISCSGIYANGEGTGRETLNRIEATMGT